MTTAPIILWFRGKDLRCQDHPALYEASQSGAPVIPVYLCWDAMQTLNLALPPAASTAWPAGGALKWWRTQTLQELSKTLESLGSRLIIRNVQGASIAETLLQLSQETGASRVMTQDDLTDTTTTHQVTSLLNSHGIALKTFPGACLFHPQSIQTQQGLPYQVYSPFWRACLAAPDPGTPLPAPSQLIAPPHWPAHDGLEATRYLPSIPWYQPPYTQMSTTWTAGEQAALTQLDHFIAQAVRQYHLQRDCPAQMGTSRLSPHLALGAISPRQIWFQAKTVFSAQDKGAEIYLKELVWREFAYHLLYHFPQTTHEPLRSQFNAFPWEPDEEKLQLWHQGKTGYPLVDAGMRELWQTGWMHNRVRMVVASFLVKHLLQPWQAGAAWFWDTLIDADLASNTLGWQWVAGCGADAAPYFRVFNPTLQAIKFDPQGTYIRRWVPELNNTPLEKLFEPTPMFSPDYPRPIVNHTEARQKALKAFEQLKQA